MKTLRNFAVFEGGDGSGTTTQIKILGETFLAEKNAGNLPVLHKTFEPTDGPVGRLIRQGLRGEMPLQNETVAYLFAADRNDHLYGPEGMQERCERGELVVCDRYVLSSLVYQGITCGEELPVRLNRDFPLPELILFFDVDPQIAIKRMSGRSQKEIFEYLEFQIKVRERYRTLLSQYGEGSRIVIIDASRPINEVSGDVWRALEKMPIFNR